MIIDKKRGMESKQICISFAWRWLEQWHGNEMDLKINREENLLFNAYDTFKPENEEQKKKK